MNRLSRPTGENELKSQPFLYQLDEALPLPKSLFYGLQWVMIALPNVMVISILCSAALGLDPAAQISFSQRLLIATGLMTLLQSLKGHGYPLLEGPSSALLLSFLVLAPHGLPAIQGGMIMGGLLLLATGKWKWFQSLSALFNPNVIGVILMLVALTLLAHIGPLLIGAGTGHPNGEVKVFGSSLLIILLVSFLSHRARGFLQTASMLAGILFGLVLFLLQGEIPWAMEGASSWVAVPAPLWGPRPSFSPASFLVFACTYLAVMVNTVGSIQGIAGLVGAKGLESRIHRGIAMTGAGGIAAGFLGVIGLVSYSISPGVVLVSRVASRYVVAMSGAMMIAFAFLPKALAFLNLIPPSVTASVLFVALATQLTAGMNIIMSWKGNIARREYFTVGLPLLLGATVAILPKPFFQSFPSALAPLIGNGLVVGIFFSLLLEHVLFRPRK